MNAPPYPWQRAQWEQLMTLEARERTAHALLLRGPAGVGKRDFATRYACALLCEADEVPARPCGQCRSCRMHASGAHPDLVVVEPEKDSRAIRVGQVRELIAALTLTRQFTRYKVALLQPADAMNRAAANSLLKTLEEPPGATVFLLVADHAAGLPATIRSRCHSVEFPAPAPGTAREWLAKQTEVDPELLLALADDAPLRALALVAEQGVRARTELLEEIAALVLGKADPLDVAQRWKGIGAGPLLGWLGACALDLARLRLAPGATRLAHPHRRAAMLAISEIVDLHALYRVVDLCLDARRALDAGVSPNEQLLLETLAAAWRRAKIDQR